MNPKHGLSIRKYITLAATKLYHCTRSTVSLHWAATRLPGKPLRG